LLKEIVIAIESYFRAHQFIKKYKLGKWVLLPGILYMLLFCFCMYVFILTSNSVVNHLSDLIGVDAWLHQQKSALLSFTFLMSSFMLRLILFFFFLSLFKYFFLVIGAPLFAYLTEKTAALLENRPFPGNKRELLHAVLRGIAFAFRNLLWQTVYLITLLLLSLVPVAGWIAPLIALFIECYYYGSSMLDYSCGRHKLPPAESVQYINRHKGLAVGNGLVFYLLHGVPVLGWIIAPTYAVIAATLSLHELPET
jgi:CysZ protein